MTEINNATNLTSDVNSMPIKQRLPLSTYILLIGQGINITVAVVSATIGAIVGSMLAPSPSLGTVAYGAQFAAVLFTTYPAASLMRRYGRKPGFMLGSMSLCVSGVIGYLSIVNSQFWLLMLSHVFVGIYIGFANYYRFAAIDNTTDAQRSRAMSLVVSGGVIAAIIGPLFSIGLRDVHGFPQFSMAYASLSGLGVLSVVLMLLWKTKAIGAGDRRSDGNAKLHVTTKSSAELNFPIIIMAICAAAGGYLIMNLLMIQAMLEMHRMGIHYQTSTLTIQAHVLAMFMPSFFTGTLISLLGTGRVIFIGFILIVITALLELIADSFPVMAIGLIILGVGWNLTYVGGGVLLSKHVSTQLQYRWQGINDSIVAVCATVGATIPSLLQNTIGWEGSNIASLIFISSVMALFIRYLPKDK